MGNGFQQISKSDFEKIKDDGTKLNIIFGYVHDLHQNHTGHKVECEARFVKLENRKKIDASISMASGFLGGASVILGKLIFWK